MATQTMPATLDTEEDFFTFSIRPVAALWPAPLYPPTVSVIVKDTLTGEGLSARLSPSEARALAQRLMEAADTSQDLEVRA